MTVETNYYDPQKKDKLFFVSIFILIVVCASTAGLFGFNWYVENGNDAMNTEISNLDTSINVLKADKRIQAFDVLEANKQTLADMKAKSQIPNFIRNIKSIALTYGMTFQGFDYANGIVTTKALFSGTGTEIAYPKLTKFISDYRDRAKKENLMELLFVNSVIGQDQIEVTTQFKVK